MILSIISFKTLPASFIQLALQFPRIRANFTLFSKHDLH